MFNMRGESGCHAPVAGGETVTIGKEECVMNSFRLVVSIVVIGLLVGCSSTTTSTTKPKSGLAKVKVKPFVVKLEVTKNSRGEVVLENKNNKTQHCDKFPDQDKFRKGCIVAEVNEVVDIDFKLSGSGIWRFAEFQICTTADPNNKSNFKTCELDAVGDWMVLTDGVLRWPDNFGKVDVSVPGKKITQFKLLDLNVTKADYFYQVCVKNTDTECNVPDNCVCTDPGGQNKGRLN
jgi:hypothetical protein